MSSQKLLDDWIKRSNVFEKRLIEAYISEHGTDPVNGEELSVDDLVELKTARIVRPRPPTHTSIPSLLAVFQNEWDAIVLETYQLKQQLAQTRQELSTALYQHDAAVRVIARVTKERDEARAALSQLSISGGGAAASNGDAMQVDGQALPNAIASKVDAVQQKLSTTRRKRAVPEDWATPESLQNFGVATSIETTHRSAKTLAVSSNGDSAIVAGPKDSADIYNLATQEVTQAAKANGTITDSLWWSGRQVISNSTGGVQVFEDGVQVAEMRAHAGPAVAIDLHPCGDLLGSVGIDKSYVLYDLTSFKAVSQVRTDSELTTGKFHPDGHLFAVGTSSGQIQVFDVKTGANMASFAGSGSVQALAFSENGTWLASVVQGQSTVSIWDLRKSSEIKVHDIGNVVSSVVWDYTGQFLAAAGPGSVTILHYAKSSKSWSEPFRKAIPASAVQWGSQAQSLVVLGIDGTVSVLEEEE
ncbi:MAG: hypothetical protein M1821_000164 [Bathelium mastoideum]|nr:MAG: hypothetical protein M1821_000164 [Bathelium mastoideum]